ncbi:hypothetical protein LTR86_001141 [Recurvomyces mirabilis]|nr:hypothetical protein LTR86_001141 [Recurvomyces mirabilis]
MAAQKSNPKQCGTATLLTLPPELRLHIYEVVMDDLIELSGAPFDGNLRSTGTDKPTLHRAFDLNLLHLTRQTRHEARPVVDKAVQKAILYSMEALKHRLRLSNDLMTTRLRPGAPHEELTAEMEYHVQQLEYMVMVCLHLEWLKAAIAQDRRHQYMQG